MKCICTFLGIILISTFSRGQSAQTGDLTLSNKKSKADTNYVQNYKNYLTIGVFTATPITSLTISSLKDSTIKPITYTANLANIVGVTLAYKSIYVAFGFRTPVESSSVDQYGTTKFKAFSIRVQNPKFFVGFDYRSIKGYYSDSLIGKTIAGNDEYFKRTDISTNQYMLSGIYNFNWKKYSYLAPLNYTERQVKTKTGFLLKTSISYNTLHSDSTLIASSTNTTATQPSSNVADIYYVSYKVGPGLGLNVVIAKRVYFSLQAFYSIDMVAYWYSDNKGDLKNSDRSITGFVEGRAALGYQSKRFYAGIKFIGDQVAVRTKENKISNAFGVLTLDVGYRFNAPGILRKAYKGTFTRFLGL